MSDNCLSNGQFSRSGDYLKHNIVPIVSPSSNESQRSVSDLEAAIEAKTKERNELREKLRQIVRATERLELFWSSRLESKERELRLFLHSSTARTSINEVDAPKCLLPDTNVTANSTLRPVPTLVSSLKKPVDSLLGPATFSASINSPSNGLLPTPSTSTTQTCTDSNVHSSTSRHTSQTAKSTSDSNQWNAKEGYKDVLVDPSIDLVLSRFRHTQRSFEDLITSNQADLQSFTFTQNSQNGKRMMMRIRVLEQENEELANMNRTGPTSRLDTEIALRRAFVEDLKQSHSDMEYLIEEVESETELLGSSLLMLQQRLQFAHATAKMLADELDKLEPVNCTTLNPASIWSSTEQMDTDHSENVQTDSQLMDQSDCLDQSTNHTTTNNNNNEDAPSDHVSDVISITNDEHSLPVTSTPVQQDKSDLQQTESNCFPSLIVEHKPDLPNKPVTRARRKLLSSLQNSSTNTISSTSDSLLHQSAVQSSSDNGEPLLKKLREEYADESLVDPSYNLPKSKPQTQSIVPTQITRKRIMINRQMKQNPVNESLERTSSCITNMSTIHSSNSSSSTISGSSSSSRSKSSSNDVSRLCHLSVSDDITSPNDGTTTTTATTPSNINTSTTLTTTVNSNLCKETKSFQTNSNILSDSGTPSSNKQLKNNKNNNSLGVVLE